MHWANGATFDRTGKYRYRLWRTWNDRLPNAAIVMLNPSAANQSVDDPTIRSCIRIAGALSFGGIEVVNLFAYCTAHPRQLRNVRAPIGKENDRYITEACASSASVIVAWGNYGDWLNRDEEVIALLNEYSWLPFCFGTTNRGEPRHPLYLSSTTGLMPFAKPKPSIF